MPEGVDGILLSLKSCLWLVALRMERVGGKNAGKKMFPPFSCNPLYHFNAPQHAGPPLPHVAVVVEVIYAGQKVELDHAEHPIAVLDKHTNPGGRLEINVFMTILDCLATSHQMTRNGWFIQY